MNLNDYTPTILVVDDVPANLDVMVAHLQQENIELMVALSGEEGLELAKAKLPDLILLDIMMPGIDGYETCRRLKSDPLTADIPVVFLSAKSDEIDVEKGLNLGAVDYINKPFSLPILRARLNNHLALKHKSDMLIQLACTDELTRIANRRHFDLIFEREWLRAQRNQTRLSLLMIDVDHFKQYNDHYGHGEGDRCLKQVARALTVELHRPADLLARYGGEEFVVLLPETDFEDAEFIANQLAAAVEKLAIAHKKSTCAPHVTISIGLASQLPGSQASRQQLLKQADRSLYKAKNSGRNQVYGTMSAINEAPAAN
ncbi:MAG: diguanylate cyclase [Gammaproteobacteria bacterium]|nr:diguanylate cyclase [Gammaproteobacteria bacterium]